VHNSTITFDRHEHWFVLNTNTLGLLESGNPGGVIEFRSTKDGSLLATVLMLNPYRRDWLAVAPEGFFDGTATAWDKVLWRFDGNTFDVVPVEVYFRDFFVPGVLASLDHTVTLPQVSSITNLNRTQPSVEIMKVTPGANRSNEASVVVTVSTVKSKVQKDEQQHYFESGVYDVRLFRDGQLVGQWPAPGTVHEDRPNAGNDNLEPWRKAHRVPLNASGKARITFQHVLLQARAGIKTAEFTAYAFNSDRVKSLTTPAFSYALPTSEKGEIRPRAYLIPIGVNANESRWNLELAVSSAERARVLLRTKLQAEYSEVIEIPLYSELAPDSYQPKSKMARKADFKAALDLLAGRSVDRNLRDEWIRSMNCKPQDLTMS
jgi:hypothetical protein